MGKPPCFFTPPAGRRPLSRRRGSHLPPKHIYMHFGGRGRWYFAFYFLPRVAGQADRQTGRPPSLPSQLPNSMAYMDLEPPPSNMACNTCFACRWEKEGGRRSPSHACASTMPVRWRRKNQTCLMPAQEKKQPTTIISILPFSHAYHSNMACLLACFSIFSFPGKEEGHTEACVRHLYGLAVPASSPLHTCLLPYTLALSSLGEGERRREKFGDITISTHI